MPTPPTLKRFDTEVQLTNYVDSLNENGMTPELAIMDSRGSSMLATLQAPGGEGWGFAYYGVNDADSGTIVGDEHGTVKPARYLDEWHTSTAGDWQPTFPVFGIVADLV